MMQTTLEKLYTYEIITKNQPELMINWMWGWEKGE